MKKVLVSHIVSAIINHRKLIIIISILLCVLSIISFIALSKLDLSMEGMAGKSIKEVNDFMDTVKKFNVSGMTYITLQPKEDKEKKATNYYNVINDIYFKSINENEKNELFRMPMVYYGNETGSETETENKNIVSIIIDMLGMIDLQSNTNIIYDIKSLTLKDKIKITSGVKSNDYEVKKTINNKLQTLTKSEKITLASSIYGLLKTENKDDVIKMVINYLINTKTKIDKIFERFNNTNEINMELLKEFNLINIPSLFEKIRFEDEIIKNTNGETKNILLKSYNISSDNKTYSLNQNLSELDKLRINNILTQLGYDSLNLIFKDFKRISEIFATEIKEILLSDRTAKVSKNGLLYLDVPLLELNKIEKLSDLVNGVMFSDEISLSNDKLTYMILVAPKKDISILSNSRIFAQAFDAELNKLKSKYQNEIIVKRTGLPVMNIDEESAILNNVLIQLAITIVGILIIFAVGLKKITYPLLSMIPLAISIIIMFGIYSLVIQTINIITIITPIVLFGMGIDYSIHFGARYGEVRAELGNKATQAEVLTETFNSIGFGLATGAMMTMLAFLSLVSSSIVSFVHLAFMSSVGVLTAFLSMVYVLPVIITSREKRHNKVEAEFLNSKKYDRFGKFANSRWGTAFGIIIIVLFLSSVILLPQIEIETEKDALLPKEIESIITSEILSDKFGASYIQTFFILKGYDELLEFEKEIRRKDGERKIYSTINPQTINARRAIREFEKLGWDNDPDTLSEYVEMYANKESLTGGSNKNIAILYEFFARNYVDWKTNEYLVLASASGYVWQEEFFYKHIEELELLEKELNSRRIQKIIKLKTELNELKIDEEENEEEISELKAEIENFTNASPIIGSGVVKIWNYLLSNMLWDLLKSSGIALLVIIIILTITSKSLRGTIICSLSMIISIIATLSLISLFDMKLNFVNILAFPIVIGLGIDYSVHIYYRLIIEGKGNILNVLSSTGKAVILSTLTTLMAFGTLSFSSHNGIAKIGIFAFIGLVLSFLTSIFVIPTLVKLFYRKKLKELAAEAEENDKKEKTNNT